MSRKLMGLLLFKSQGEGGREIHVGGRGYTGGGTFTCFNEQSVSVFDVRAWSVI